MAGRRFPSLEARQLVQVCHEFLSGISAQGVADNLNERLKKEGIELPAQVNRQQVYALVSDARKRGFFVLRPPLEAVLNRRVADVYGLDAENIEVVDAEGPSTGDFVADRAAKRAMRLIKEVGAAKQSTSDNQRVHLGLGAGYTTMNIARHLAHELRAEDDLPDLVLHALTSGFRVEQPQTAPVSFFGSFGNLRIKVGYVGLFARPVVKREHYAGEIDQPGAVEAFKRRHEIDIVITSLASAQDEHGDLNMFLRKQPEDIQQLRDDGWVGDVMYRPYSETGPLTREASIRALTLFELIELIDLVKQPNKYVLLVSGPCGHCGMNRSGALRPLLSSAQLKVWSHIIMDRGTAQDLVAANPKAQRP